MARVAAVPERLADEEQSYVAYFTEEDLFAALPFDCRMRKRPSEILAILRAHAARIRPLAPTEPAPGQRLHPASELPLEPLRHLETVATVVTTDLQQELGAEARCEAKQQVAYEQAVQQSVGRGVYKRQTLLLQQLIEQQPPVSVPSARSFQIAALRALGRRLPLWLLQARFRNAAAYRALQKAKSYLPRLMDYIRRTGQRLLNLVPQRGRRRGEVQWHVTIGIPDHLLTRA